MTKCLVTKHDGVCSNDTLPKLGEFRMTVYSSLPYNSSYTEIQVSKDTTAEIVGNGYFTDSTHSENKGKSVALTTSRIDKLYINCTEDCFFVIKDEMAIVRLQNLQDNIGFDLDNIAFTNINYIWVNACSKVTGDISVLKSLTGLVTLNLSSTSVTGDISVLKSLTGLTTLNLSSTSVTGDISVLKSLTGLATLNLSSTSVTGDISVLKSLTGLTTLDLSSTSVTGDISVLKSLVKLSNHYLIFNSSNSFYGNLGAIPDSVLHIAFKDNKNNNLTWTSSDRTKILSVNATRCSTIDDFLNGVANLTAEFANDSWGKSINLIGTRTSASDAAVATLQSKGYTVLITPA